MLDKLFNSKTRVKILSLFFDNKGRDFYVQEVVKMSGSDAANTHRELERLEKFGVLKSKKINKQKFFSLNTESEFYPGLEKIFNAYNKIQNKDKWFLFEEIPNCYPLFASTGVNKKISDNFFKSVGLKNRVSEILMSYEDNVGFPWLLKSEFDKLSEEVIQKYKEDPDWGDDYNKKVVKEQKELFLASKKLLSINLAKLSNKELYKVFDDIYSIYTEVFNLHWIHSVVDYGDNLFSKYLLDYLKDIIANKKYSVGEVFSTLTIPTEDGNQTKEHESLLGVLEIIQKNPKTKKYFEETETRIILEDLKKVNSQVDKRIEKHTKDFGWLGYGITGPSWDKKYFVDILSSLVRQKTKPSESLKRIEKEKSELIKKQKNLVKELGIDETHRRMFEIAKGLIFSKGMRKDSMFYNFSVMENLYREIGKRFYLSLKQVRFMYVHEIRDLLLKDKLDAKRLNERPKFSIQYSTGKLEDDILLEGERARKFVEKFDFIKENIEDVKMLYGDCASAGRVKGEVAIVNTVDDMKNFKDGNVLVSIATNPDLVPAIKKSVAIITDVGGVTCHASIISRELGVPCVIGTKIATKVLKDGDVVDVDATHGKVTIIKKAK